MKLENSSWIAAMVGAGNAFLPIGVKPSLPELMGDLEIKDQTSMNP